MNFGEPIWREGSFLAGMDPPGMCDVAVVGGGYTGLTAAYRLASAGKSVCVFDSLPMGEGASSRNAGFVTVTPPVAAARLFRQGADRARQWFRWFDAAVDTTEALVNELSAHAVPAISFRRRGSTKLALTSAEVDALRAEIALLARIGRRYRMTDASDLGPPLSDRFRAGRTDEASATLNPGAFHLALATAARGAGAVLADRCTVNGAEETSAGISVSHARGRTLARQLLVATNGYSAAAPAPFRRFVLSVRSAIIVTEPIPVDTPLGSLGEGMSFHTATRLPHYFRIIKGRRLLFGGRRATSPRGESPASWLASRARRLLPGLEVPRIAYAWDGRLGFARHREPLLGRLSESRFYAMGCAGHGVPTSVAFGEEIAARILGRTCLPAPFWREPCAPPSPMPRFASGLLPSAFAWMQTLDRVDAVLDAARASGRRAAAGLP